MRSDTTDNGRVPKAAPGSREPSREGVSAASGFDPSRNTFILRLRQFNEIWGIKKEPSIEQAAHMLAVFGLELIPSSRPFADSRPISSGPSRGGRARAANLSPDRRSEIAREAAAARWSARDRDGSGEAGQTRSDSEGAGHEVPQPGPKASPTLPSPPSLERPGV